MLQIRVLLSFFLVIYAGQLWAQVSNCDFTLKGAIRDEEGVALPGATIWVESLRRGTTSDSDGSFTLNRLCAKEFLLHIKFVGYEDQLLTVKVPDQNELTVFMQPSISILHDIVVVGEHARQHGLSQSVSTLSKEQLDANVGKPLGELMKQIPGVSALMTGPSIFKPVIHGLHSQRILILNNGIRQDGQQWGVEHAPEIDTYIASEIEVVKGAETVRYGADAIGGVIIVNAPQLHKTSGLEGELNAGLMSNGRMGVFSGLLEGGFKNVERWSWRLQGTAKKGGDFHAADYNLSNTGVEELNFSGALGYKKDDREFELYYSSFNTALGILRSAHTGSLEDLQNSIENEQPIFVKDFTYTINNPRQKINHQLVKVKANRNIEGLGKLNFLYGFQYNQRKEYDIRRGGRSGTPALSLELFSNVVDLSLDHTFGNWVGSAGVNGTFKTNNNVPGTGIKPLIPNYNQYSGGLFVIEKFRRDRWLFETGIRFDHQYLQALMLVDNKDLVKPDFNFNYFAGSVGFSYYFNERSRFSSNLGISSRPPHVSELYSDGLHHSTASIEEGLLNKNGEMLTDQSLVKKELSKKWISTYQFVNDKMTIEITGYLNFIDNYVYLKPYDTRLTIRGFFPVFQYRQTNALLAGSDVSLNLNVTKHLSYNGKLSYLYANDVTHDDKLPFIPPIQWENSISYMWAAAGKLKDVYVTVSVPTTLRQYRAPVTVYPEDIPDYTGDRIFDFMSAPDGYTLLNMEAGAKIPVGKHKLSVIVSGENLGNVSYRNYMNRLRYYADDLGRNITLRVKYDLHSH